MPGAPTITVPKLRLWGETSNRETDAAGVALIVGAAAVAVATGVVVAMNVGMAVRTGVAVAVGVDVAVAVAVIVDVAVAVGVAVTVAAGVGVGIYRPVPVMVMTCGLFTAVSVIVRVSERGPGCCGPNTILIEHEV